MRYSLVVATAIGVVVGAAVADDKKDAPAKGATAAPLGDLKAKASYGLGVSIARNFKAGAIDVDVDVLLKGFRDEFSGGKKELTDEEIQAALTAFGEQVQSKQAAMAQQKADAAKKAGGEYLVANKKKEGIVELPSGLQYKVLKAGTGAMPKATDVVKTHYRGTLTDGTEFDSSYKRNEPASFPLNQVIKGWTEAIQLMKVGSKWQLFIPSDLAYGPQGRPPVIPPNATLVFEVELLDIVK